MCPSEPESPGSAAASATNAGAPRDSLDDPPRFAFAGRYGEPANVAEVNDGVAAVLRFIAAVLETPEHTIPLDPVAADGLGRILTAAHADLLTAAEFAGGAAASGGVHGP